MTATVRSVRVVMEAEVAKYVADMRMAGRETDKAFDSLDNRLKGVNTRLAETDRRLQALSKTDRDVAASVGAMNTRLAEADTRILAVGNSADRSRNKLDTFSGRAGILLQLLAGFGPSLIPIGAVGIPAVAGLAGQLGFAAGAGGAAVLAFQGIGDALDDIEKARLDPTVANLEAADLAVRRLAPAAQDLVAHLEALRDEGRLLQFTAAEGFLPGIDAALYQLEARIPQARRVLTEISTAAGEALADGAESIASDRWDVFFRYLRDEARPTLDGVADSVGNVSHGVFELLAATTPLQRDFTAWLRRSTESFDEWATRLDSDPEFLEFLAYVRENGPQVAETAGSVASAFVEIVEAAAPLGGPTLQILEALADVVGAIAGSDLGTPILTGLAALSLYNRGAAITARINKTAWGGEAIANLKGYQGGLFSVVSAQDRARTSATQLAAAERERVAANRAALATAAKGAALVGGLAIASSGAADSIGLTNTASLALMGTLGGPWGIAVGSAIGLAMDMAAANNDVSDSLAAIEAALPDLEPTNSSMSRFSALIKQAEQDLDRLKADVGEGFGAAGPMDPSQNLAGFKNWAEGIFGSSDVEEAEAELARYNDQLAATRVGLGPVLSMVPGLGSVFETAGIQVGSANDAMSTSMRQVAAAARYEAESIQVAIDAMREKRAEALRGLNAELDYEQAIDDARRALKDNGKTVDETTDKGRANLRALYAMAAGWNEQSDAAKNARGSLREARQEFIETATAMGMGEEKARRLARRLFEIPERVLTKVETETTDAERKIRAIKQQLNSIDRSIDVYVNIRRPNAGGLGPQIDFARGGYTGDGGKHEPAGIVHRGEFVVDAERTRRDRGMLESRYGRLPGYAGGGMVGSPRQAWHSIQDDWADDLTAAAGGAAHGLRGLEKQLAKAEKAYDRQSAVVDRWKARYDQIASSAADSVKSELFTSSGNVWAAGGGMSDPLSVLDSDIANIEAMERLRARLARRGLDDGALEAAAAGGLAGLQQIAGYSPAELAEYERKFNLRDHLAGQYGQGLATAVVGDELKASNKKLDRLIDRVHDVERAIKTADDGNREGHKQAPKDFAESLDNLAGAAARRAN